jgi:hypothetical protein
MGISARFPPVCDIENWHVLQRLLPFAVTIRAIRGNPWLKITVAIVVVVASCRFSMSHTNIALTAV